MLQNIVRILKFVGAVGTLLAVGVLRLNAQEFQPRQTDETFPTMRAAIDAIASKYNIHVGLEYAIQDSDRTPISLDLSTSTVVPVFDSLIAQRIAYRWKFDGKFYDLYPKLATDSLLDVSIRSFAIKDATPEQVSTAISSLPEVIEWLRRNHATRRELETGPSWGKADQRTSLSLGGIPLRSVLNRLVLEMGRTNWIVVRYGNNAEYIAIYI